jgi:hypothetical protein
LAELDQLGVALDSLRKFIHEDGSLTAQGQAKIQREVFKRPTQPVTSQLLQDIQALGREGIHRAGGVAALANQYGVAFGSLRNLIREDGSLTARGQAKIQREGLK